MSVRPDWWENFFSGIALEFWRQAITEEQTRLEADFIAKMLSVGPAAKILDAPCGEGRLCRELAARGFQMTGVDLAPDFIEEARRKAAERKLEITWKLGDIRNLEWEQEFDGAFCMGGSFGYFDDAGNANYLKSIARALKPGGRFVLDGGRVAEGIFSNYREREWVQVGDILFLEENRYDHIHGRMETEYTFVRDGIVEKKSSSDRIYTYRELCVLLDQAGFTECRGYGSLPLEPFKFGVPALFLVATKVS